MNAKIALTALSLVSLAACASVEPPPCTAEWVDYKTDAVLKEFAVENRSLINDLRRLQDDEGKIDPVTALQLVSKSKKIRKFADSFETIVVPELEAAVDQCGEGDRLVPAFTEFLRKEGVGEATLEWVGPVIGLIQTMREDEVSRQETL